MAKTTGPLMSLDAHGSLAKTLTYSRRRSGSQSRKYNKPTGTASAKQRGQRRLTEFLVAQWQSMNDNQKNAWEAAAKASDKNLPGYHYFLREAQRDLYTHHGLSGYWHFNEIVNGTVLDLSGNGNHGTLQPDYPSNAPSIVVSRSTKFGNALSFDGVDETVTCGTGASLNIRSAITVEEWVKIPAGGTSRGIINKGRENSTGYYTYIKTDGEISLALRIGEEFKEQFGVLQFADNEWHCFAATWDGDAIRVYGDGKLEVTLPDVTGTIVDSTGEELIIGWIIAGNAFMKGLADELCIYNRTLSTAEIATRSNFATKKV